MRKLSIVVAVVLALALPAGAAEPECTVVEILHVQGTPKAGEVHWAGGPHYAVNGKFAWFDYSIDPSGGEFNTVSVDVSDPSVVRATGCPDGSVWVDHAPVDVPVVDGPSVDPQPEPEPVVSTMSPVCETHASTMERYCSLPNLVLVIS